MNVIPQFQIKKFWLYLPASWSHFLSPVALKFYSQFLSQGSCKWKAFHWRNCYFPNPLGTAGGIDKNACHISHWQSLGAGFVEIGTITPEAQKANPSPILDRSIKYKSLWNNMGFPNKGMRFVHQKLLSLSQKPNSSLKTSPLFINIGKNRQTPLSHALSDYKKMIELLHPFASAFVINISSPNTAGLRDLFREDTLASFLKSLKEVARQLGDVPLILKLSPDEKDILRIIQQSVDAGIDGWCIVNSTKKRFIPSLFPKEGGVSGKLIASLSLQILKDVKKYLDENQIKDKLLISCGGIFTVQDILERLSAGANLIQVYSALVFEGPRFFQSVFKKISD